MNNRFEFLRQLSENNNREWFVQNKASYDLIVAQNKEFFKKIANQLQKHDSIEQIHIFRIYKDVRFSKDKTPYKTHFGASFSRTQPHLKGDYYICIEPNNSFIGGGLWNPAPADLLRIRKEFEQDTSKINAITTDPTFVKYFKTLQGDDAVKTAPKGFDKNHPAIDLIRKKNYLLMRSFSDSQVCSPDFDKEILATFLAMRPFFDYMSEVLTTDLNGESIL